MNKILADGGSDKKWTAEDYVREQFDKAMKETMLRAEDKVVKWVCNIKNSKGKGEENWMKLS